MKRWWVVSGLLLLPGAGLLAQQPAAPPAGRATPEPSGVSRIVRTFPEGTVQVIVQRRARLGVSVNFAARETDSIGALINGVTPNGPAARAGLRTGDVITSLNGRPLVVSGVRVPRGQSAPGVRLSEIAAQLEPGDTVTLQYRRGSERRVVSLVAGDEPAVAWTTPEGSFSYSFEGEPPPMGMPPRPRTADPGGEWRVHVKLDSLRGPPPGSVFPREFSPRTPAPPSLFYMMDSPLADLELAPLNPELGRYFGTSAGILVIRTPEGSNLGLQGGDVILTVDGREPNGPGHLLRILRTYAPSEVVKFEVMRLKRRETIRGTTGN